jgi:hypothetical protein
MTEQEKIELIIKLHRLEDNLAGCQIVTMLTTINHMVNRFEAARKEVLEIIGLVARLKANEN